jgi:hypothetical protein
MIRIAVALALLSGVILSAQRMRSGTARLGKSCIAWAEAVFLRSPRQRPMRGASKTVERWVIPLRTLRAIVSTSFRNEPCDKTA